MEFSLEPQTLEFKLGTEEYVLTEASSAAAIQWRNYLTQNSQRNGNGQIESINNFYESEPLLVSLLTKHKPTGKPVELEAVKQWPHKVVRKLFQEATRISGLGPDTEEQAKN